MAGVCFTLVLLLMPSWSKRSRYRVSRPNYPKGSMFFATDFFVKGCVNFLDNCPNVYKYQLICAKNYDGEYRNFNNYCDMQYENCNTWRNWVIFKRERC